MPLSLLCFNFSYFVVSKIYRYPSLWARAEFPSHFFAFSAFYLTWQTNLKKGDQSGPVLLRVFNFFNRATSRLLHLENLLQLNILKFKLWNSRLISLSFLFLCWKLPLLKLFLFLFPYVYILWRAWFSLTKVLFVVKNHSCAVL